MFARRTFLGLSVAAGLAGCTGAPLLDEAGQASLSIRSVTVQTVEAEKIVEGRQISKSGDQVASDVKRAVEARVLGRDGARQGDLVIQVKSVNLIAPGVSALVPAQSSLKAVVWVKDVKDGSQIVAPTEISAINEGVRVGGIIGVATAPSPEKDYQRTISGFAANVEKRLFGTKTK